VLTFNNFPILLLLSLLPQNFAPTAKGALPVWSETGQTSFHDGKQEHFNEKSHQPIKPK
jgi:hypothetical protein